MSYKTKRKGAEAPFPLRCKSQRLEVRVGEAPFRDSRRDLEPLGEHLEFSQRRSRVPASWDDAGCDRQTPHLDRDRGQHLAGAVFDLDQRVEREVEHRQSPVGWVPTSILVQFQLGNDIKEKDGPKPVLVP